SVSAFIPLVQIWVHRGDTLQRHANIDAGTLFCWSLKKSNGGQSRTATAVSHLKQRVECRNEIAETNLQLQEWHFNKVRA
ncbi:MAG: hypothetical protein AAB354_00840, partial [candidate division KSB1 bacterium]